MSVHRRGYDLRTLKRRKKRFCVTSPATPSSVTVTFRRRSVGHGKRRQWFAIVKPTAVTQDANGRPMTVDSYQVELRAVDRSGDPVETQGQAKATNIGGSSFSQQGGSTPTNGRARELNGSGDKVGATLTGLTAGIEAAVNFYARKKTSSDVTIKAYIYDVTAGAIVSGSGAAKNADPTSTRRSQVIIARSFTPVAGRTYEARAEYVSGSGTGLFDGVVYHDKGDAAVWRGRIKDDDDPLHASFPLARPDVWFYQARVRAIHKLGKHSCASFWTGWTTPELPTDDDAVIGPPDVTGLTAQARKDSPGGNPWRLRVRWNECPHYIAEEGDTVHGAASYDLGLEVGKGPNASNVTLMHKRRVSVIADPDSTTNEYSWHNIRGRRWYRVRVRPVDADGNPGAYSAFTSWVTPYGQPAPPTNVVLTNPVPRKLRVAWDPPADMTDVDGYQVTVKVGATTKNVGFTAATYYHYDIPEADRSLTHTAVVQSMELGYSEDVDDGETVGMSDPEPSTDANTGNVANSQTWSSDDISTAAGPISDGSPPASSPAISVTGGPRWIACTWSAISNNDPVTYEVHLSTSSAFTPSAATKVAELAGTVCFVRKDAAGTNLLYNTDYYLKLVAKDADGSAAAGAESLAVRLDPNVADDIAAGSITADRLAAVLIITNALKTAETGRRVELDAQGVRLLDADNSILVNLPTDESQAATFAGEVVASGLTVTGDAELRGAGSFVAKAGALTLQAGVVSPLTEPSVVVGWDSIVFDSGASIADRMGGFYWDGTHYYYGHSTVGFGGIRTYHIRKVDAAGAFVSLASLGTQYTPYGITKVGSFFYLLVFDNVNDVFKVRKYDTAFAYQGSEFTYTEHDQHDPALGTDGTDLLIAECDSATGRVKIRRYTTAGVLQETITSDANLAPNVGLASVDKGSFDYGATRYVVAKYGGSVVWTMNSSGTHIPSENWVTPDNTCRGIIWDSAASVFRTLASYAATLYTHTSIKWGLGDSSKWWVSYTWYDGDATGGTHETPQGPRASFTMKQRAKLTVSTAAIPDAGGTDDPDRVRVYIGRGTTDPGRTAMWQNATPAAGVTTVAITSAVFSGTNPPATNNFPGATPGKIAASQSGLELRGDGTLLLPQFTTAARPSPLEAQALYDSSVKGPWYHDGAKWLPMSPLAVRGSFWAYSDFLEPAASVAQTEGLVQSVTGTGATFSAQVASLSHPGIWVCETGTTTTGRALLSGPAGSVRFGGGRVRFGCWVMIPTLSDATNTFTVAAGFLNTNDPDAPTNAVFFRYRHNINSGAWQARTADNGTVTTDSSDDNGGAITVVAGTWYFLEIEVNAAGTQADFYIDSVLKGSLTTNIPTAAGRESGHRLFIVKSAGTTNRKFEVDAYYLMGELATAR